MSKRKMILGNPAPFVWTRGHFAEWFRLDTNFRHWPKPYEGFHERIENRRRYRSGPRPWAPGRYATSMWQTWSGYGRFSDITDRLSCAYYAERYTGVRSRPEDYWKTHGKPGEYERNMEYYSRKRSWRIAA